MSCLSAHHANTLLAPECRAKLHEYTARQLSDFRLNPVLVAACAADMAARTWLRIETLEPKLVKLRKDTASPRRASPRTLKVLPKIEVAQEYPHIHLRSQPSFFHQANVVHTWTVHANQLPRTTTLISANKRI